MSAALPSVPAIRVEALNDAPVREDRDVVLYWMTALRRPDRNFALERAVEHAIALGRPLVILEALRAGYRWASDRHHRFVIEGMADNAAAFAERPVTYLPYVEPEAGAGRGLLAALAERAAVVVTDDWPAFFLPRMTRAAAGRIDVRLEHVDGNGLLPMRAADRAYARAHDFRRCLQKRLPEHLTDRPLQDPAAVAGLPEPVPVPADVLERWPAAAPDLLDGDPAALAALPIDHSVPPAPDLQGGATAARERLAAFVADDLDRYADGRNHPDDDSASGLSPWLHFGHIGTHAVLDAVARRHTWTPDRVSGTTNGARRGWWGLPEGAESFLDELVTWRELGFNLAHHAPGDLDRFDALPAWALATLDEHESDPRPHVYGREAFESARTHDELWNAAQRQLRREGRMHNYLRMLWGKKVLHWSRTPREAYAVLEELNNRWALDGRDPNSYSGILWCFGRYERAWGPERPVFGKVRYMTSESTRSKLRLRKYLERFAPREPGLFDA